jgi:hypothetical protein
LHCDPRRLLPPIVNEKIGNRQFWSIDSLTIALRPPGVPPPIVNEKIGNRQFWSIDSLTIALRPPGPASANRQ